MEKVEFITYTVASHKGAIKMPILLHFGELLSNFISSPQIPWAKGQQ